MTGNRFVEESNLRNNRGKTVLQEIRLLFVEVLKTHGCIIDSLEIVSTEPYKYLCSCLLFDAKVW